MKMMKRALALLLCVVMVVGMMPEIAFEVGAAGNETIYVLAGGDFQEAGDHANSAENVTNILAQVSQKYETMDGFLFIGDYDCETHDSATETANGITALMGAVQGSYSNLNDANSVLVQGNHDYMDSRIDTTGGHEFEGYAAYVLNEDDYPNGGGSQSGVQTLANNLKTWLNDKIGEGYSAPIFIVSHLPLAFTPRTVTQGDAKYAKYIFDVLNDAADNGLNIIFLHGHDHAYGPDNYMGGEAIYLPKGDKICIAEAGSTSAWTEETLNFTYMNAGYVGYYSDPMTYVTTAGTDKLTMTVFAITDNQVTVERYSEDGLYNLKAAGYDGSYSNTSVTNLSLGLPKYEKVYSSPQTIKLTTSSAGSTETGTIGEWVGVSDLVEDVTTSGGKWVTINAATNGTAATPTTYEYVLDTNGIDYGSANKYLIVARNAAYLLDAGSGVAVTISSDGRTATTSTTNYEYYFTTGGLITRDGTNTLYQSSWAIHVGNESDSNLDGFTNLGNGYYRFYDNDGTERSLYWDGDSWTVTESNHTNTNYSVRLYKYSETNEGSDATPGTNGLYGYLDGNLTYNMVVGTSADDALAAVKAGIAIKYTTYEDYTNVGEYADDGEGMTWILDPAYGDGTTPGDYAVTISYNGTVLGTAKVVVPAQTTYYVAEGNGLYLVDMNTTADNAMAAVKAGVTVYSATDASGSNKTAISDDDVTWNWVDKYDGTNYGPYTVEILYEGTSLGTVEVKVDVQYETGITNNFVSAGTTPTQYRYVLDTDGYETGSNNRYLFVASDAAYAMDEDGSGVVDVTFNDVETEAIVDSRDYEWYITTYRSGRTTYYPITKNGTTWIYHENYGMSVGTNDNGYWSINENDQDEGLYRFSNVDGSTWYLYYDSADRRMEVSTSSSNRVRLYKYDGEIEGGNVYAKIEGNTVYTVTLGKSSTSALNTVKAGITGYISSNADGSNSTELEDSELTWTWKNKYNGNMEGSYWVEISYNGEVLGTVEVKVEPGVVNNYPEYPNEGAVKVNKTATGIDFQSSGIAQIELSASGVPIKKGVDLIVMLDTSSSMTSNTVTGSSMTREEVLEDSLKDLIAQLKTPGDDGQLLDIKVAIADFNGFYGEDVDTDSNNSYNYTTGTPYDREDGDTMSDGIDYQAVSTAEVYTGDYSLGAGAFISAAELEDSYNVTTSSGTNYDYAMDAIYQLGTAIKEANGNEDRDLYVIFMSDGAAMQWNYYHSQGESSLWNDWITGKYATVDEAADALLIGNGVDNSEHKYYYNAVDTNGDGMYNEHWMANAIKGDPSTDYKVIRKTNTLGTPVNGEENMYMVPGLGAKMFSISFDAKADTNVTEESMDKSIETLASEQTGTTQYYYKVTSADELAAAFNVIGSEIAYAASNARFVDQMGDSYNLQMTPFVDMNGNPIKDANGNQMLPSIQIVSYDIYTRQDYLDELCTEDQIGNRKGTYNVLETVTFNSDGTQAYSDKIGGGTQNILIDGVICAQTFWYNTLPTDVAIAGVDIPTGTKADGTTTGSTNVLPSETFYWKMGTVQTSELAMRYYVYLEGSMEGTKGAGSYATNEYAVLYYDNYLGNPAYKDTMSPTVAWKEANVSYAFYLVNENGEIIVNQTTGQTGSFANKVAVTNPVLYKTILLNNTANVNSIEIASADDGVLPKYYKLYDEKAKYTITINSNSTGAWEIVKGEVDKASTYVTQYSLEDASSYTNKTTANSDAGDNYDYTHTIVWFAVVWSVQAHPDSVVVDYGLPVDISVLANDMFGENGKLAGIGSVDNLPEGYDAATEGGKTLATGFGSIFTGKYGTAKADTITGKVRYTLNTMSMNGYDKFAYAVNYTGTNNPGYYYDTITVIPATTIYYEDSFVEFDNLNWEAKEGGYAWEGEWVVDEAADGSMWTPVGTTVDATQDEDRPGRYSLTDANNIYGYDSVNLNMLQYSLGSAMKATVDYDHAAQASFTFTGTGFDIISMTDSTTGTIFVDVYSVNADGTNGEQLKSLVVDTYYGYNYGLYNVTYTFTNNAWVKTIGTEITTEGAVPQAGKFPETPTEGVVVTATELLWALEPNSNEHIWQVPVMKVEGLTYGEYRAVVRAVYEPAFDHVDGSESGTYDFYLDAIRIYDPANDGTADGTTDTTIEDAYKTDGEGWPSYLELRNALIDAETLGNSATNTEIPGLVFIDGKAEVGDAQIKDYENFGPNNEVYLAPGQRVAFILNTPDNVDQIHIGLKSANGAAATWTITNVAQAGNNETGVEAGDYYGAKTSTINTATEMYYNITGYKGDIIVISNTGDKYNTTGILSITNIKSTYTSNPGETITKSDSTAEENLQTYSVMSLSAMAEEPAAESNETTIYMTPAAATLALRAVNTMYLPEPEAFEPEKLEIDLNKNKVKEGDKVKVTVKTSDDVDYITVNGQTITRYQRNRRTGERTWTVNLKAEEAGKLTVEVIAYDADDVASEAVTETVTVEAKKNPKEIIKDILKDLFGRFFG